MSSSRTIVLVFGALTSLCWSPKDAVAHSTSLSSAQLVQRSTEAMRSVGSAHSQSTVQVVTARWAGRASEQVTASISADCTGTGIRAKIRGTVIIGKGLPHAINTLYVILYSSSNTGGSTRTDFWERDATKTTRWRKVPTVVQEPAYGAFLAADVCPTDGRAFRVALGMPHAHMDPPARAISLGRAVWAVSGTSGSSSEHFSFRLLIDRATYRLDSYAGTYEERLNGQVVAHQQTLTTYSRYGAPVTILAPANAGLHGRR
jgi:hypothetical protein